LNVIKLCKSTNKALTFISTLSAAEAPSFRSGYASSKFVAEQLVRRHLPDKGIICRLPFILFHRDTGGINPRDWLTLAVQGCLECGLYPSSFPPQQQLVCLPVDQLTVASCGAGLSCYALSLDLFFVSLGNDANFPQKRRLTTHIQPHFLVATWCRLLLGSLHWRTQGLYRFYPC
jgi:hypothetical protein